MAIADLLRKLVELKKQLVANLNSMGVVADENEKLNTLVPKVLECETEQNVEWIDEPSGTFTYPGNLFKKLTIPEGITQITVSETANLLEELYLPRTLTGISLKNKFTNVKKLITPHNISCEYTSSNNALETLTIIQGDSTASMPDWAYASNTLLKTVVIENGVTRIGDYAIYNNKSLVNISIPDSVTSIGIQAFAYCESLESITIPDSVTEMGAGVFYDCRSLKHVKLPNGVTSLSCLSYSQERHGFFGICVSLESVVIPDSVTSIGGYAFYRCFNLADIYYTGTEEQWSAISKENTWNWDMGDNVSGGTTIHYNYVPEGGE